MAEQRTRARESRQQTQSMQVQNETLANITTPSVFVGYETLEATTEIEDILVDGVLTDSAESGDVIQFVLRETPFYAVSGGQIADTGLVSHDDFEVAVTEVVKAPNGQNLHTGTVKFGRVHRGRQSWRTSTPNSATLSSKTIVQLT